LTSNYPQPIYYGSSSYLITIKSPLPFYFRYFFSKRFQWKFNGFEIRVIDDNSNAVCHEKHQDYECLRSGDLNGTRVVQLHLSFFIPIWMMQALHHIVSPNIMDQLLRDYVSM
jgi:hypothetical protein